MITLMKIYINREYLYSVVKSNELFNVFTILLSTGNWDENLIVFVLIILIPHLKIYTTTTFYIGIRVFLSVEVIYISSPSYN